MQQILVLIGQKSEISQMSKKLIEVRDYTCVSVEKVIEAYLQSPSSSAECKAKHSAGQDLDNTIVASLIENALSPLTGKVLLVNYPRSNEQMSLFSRSDQVKFIVNLRQRSDNLSEQEMSAKQTRWNNSQEMVNTHSKHGRIVQIGNSCEQLLSAEQQKYYFVMGPPCSNKTATALSIQKLTGYTLISLQDMIATSPTQYVNALIRLFQQSTQTNFIIDGFFTKVQEYELFREFCGKPQQVFGLQKSKEQIYNGMKDLCQKEQSSIKTAFDCFMSNKQDLQQSLSKDSILMNITSSSQVAEYFHPQLYLAHCEQAKDNFKPFAAHLYQHHNIINIDMAQVKDIQSLQHTLHYSANNKSFLLSNCQKSSIADITTQIAPIKYLLDFNQDKMSVDEKACLSLNYKQSHKAMRLDLSALEKSIATFEGFICKRNQWAIVLGGIGVGKTEVVKSLSVKLGMKAIDWEALATTLKEKLSTDDEQIDELKFTDYLTHFSSEFIAGQSLIIDGWSMTEDNLQQMVAVQGKPMWVINLKADKAEQITAFKRKREMEADAEMQEEDTAACDGAISSQTTLGNYLESTSQQTFNMDFYNVTVSSGLGKLLSHVNSIFQKRVVALLGQTSIDQVMAVAYNNNMTLICIQNLVDQELLATTHDSSLKAALLKEWQMQQSGSKSNQVNQYSQEVLCLLVKQALTREVVQPRDILLLGFPRQSGSNHALEELKALEEMIGEVVQLYQIKGSQMIEYDDHIESAKGEQVQEKKELAEGEEEEEKKDDDEEGKTKFNPDLYAWSKQSNAPKHLAQVFAKFKTPACETVKVDNQMTFAKILDSLLCSYLANPVHKLVFIN